MKESQNGKYVFSMLDCCLLLILTIISFYTRLYRIAFPSSISFDEVHFGNFSSWYINHRFHFDIHPPLAKMIMGLIGAMTQYEGNINFGIRDSNDYTINEHFYVSQRITCGIFSSMVAPLLFCACRCLHLSSSCSFFGGLTMAMDTTTMVEGRFILSDGILHFFSALHIFSLSLFFDKPTFLRNLFAGITLGASFSCKYTALCMIALDGITQVVWIFVNWPPFSSIFKRALTFILPAIITFLTVWNIHFIITPYTGHCSHYYQYPETLFPYESNLTQYWGKRLLGPGMIKRIIKWNQVMHGVNVRSKIPHPSDSMPLNWPLMRDHWVFFNSGRNGERVVCLGNPFVYWSSTISIGLTIFFSIFKKMKWQNAFLLLGWSVSYFPFILVPRTMYNYHYIIPLMFTVLNMFAMLDCFGTYGVAFAFIVSYSCVWSLHYFSPWIFFFPIEDGDNKLLWMIQWTNGPNPVVNDFGLDMFNTTEKFASLSF